MVPGPIAWATSGNFLEMQFVGLHHRPNEWWVRNSRVGAQDLCFNKPSEWFWCTLKFENHSSNSKQPFWCLKFDAGWKVRGKTTWGKGALRRSSLTSLHGGIVCPQHPTCFLVTHTLGGIFLLETPSAVKQIYYVVPTQTPESIRFGSCLRAQQIGLG